MSALITDTRLESEAAPRVVRGGLVLDACHVCLQYNISTLTNNMWVNGKLYCLPCLYIYHRMVYYESHKCGCPGEPWRQNSFPPQHAWVKWFEKTGVPMTVKPDVHMHHDPSARASALER